MRRGHSLHRIEVRPASTNDQAVPSDPAWLPLIVARSLDDRTVWELADEGISFLDERGNANLILDGEPVLFSRAPAAEHHTPSRPGSPQPARAPALMLGRRSHRVAFALLCNPRLADATHRVVAAAAGVSLGTAATTLSDLAMAGYLDSGHLVRGGDLLDEWTRAFRRVTFKALTPRPLFAQTTDWAARLVHRASPGVLLGGAAAAATLPLGLRAGDGIVYTVETGSAVKLLRLTPNPSPFPVELRERFWGQDFTSPEPGLAPSVLIYGDLARESDLRLHEAAAELRESDAHLRALDAR